MLVGYFYFFFKILQTHYFIVHFKINKKIKKKKNKVFNLFICNFELKTIIFHTFNSKSVFLVSVKMKPTAEIKLKSCSKHDMEPF